jgi:hypothetical protein
MIARAVVLLSFGLAASAEARETAALRIGSHDGFVRVVIESPSRGSFTGSVMPGGRQSVIETSAELSLTRPGRPTAPISAITDSVRGANFLAGRAVLDGRVGVGRVSTSTKRGSRKIGPIGVQPNDRAVQGFSRADQSAEGR